MNPTDQKTKIIALLGNPNVGKTTLFNALTGLRHTTANYPGVTVEKITGTTKLTSGQEVQVLDLPGSYSLQPKSPDETVVRDVLAGAQEGTPKPDLAVVILDANNLERNLYLTLQVIDTGIPVLAVLNMWDAAEESGKLIQIEKLQNLLGVHCVKTIANRKEGISELKEMIEKSLLYEMDSGERFHFKSLSIEERYQKIESIAADVIQHPKEEIMTFSDRIDSFLTHPVWGWVAFISLMSLVFQSIFTWATPFMDFISTGVESLGSLFTRILPDGQLESLVVDGIVAGVGNVIIFLPQIFLLFFFIALFEDFGYMARAAFVLDRVMKKVGLNGKAFLPLLSSFACAIPGIMATRTIQDRNDRFATILVAPLMSCSARLPVYALMIGAFIPAQPVFGFLDLKGVTLLAMYFLSIFAGLGMAALFRKTLLKGNHTPFLLELPPYRVPRLRTVFMMMWMRGREFLINAGSIIFMISIILWFLVSYPKNDHLDAKFENLRNQAEISLAGDGLQTRLHQLDHEESSERLQLSFAGKLGAFIEPAIKPLGFDWKIGIGLVSSFAAREVLVSTLAIIYNVGEDADETSVDLIGALKSEKDPVTGEPIYTPLVAVGLMVFFVLACQCMSTVAIVKRETNSWRWPIFMFTYMTALAWLGSFAVYQGGKFLGWG